MSERLREFLDMLTLTRVSSRADEEIFTAPSARTAHGRIFGGQALSQSFMAARLTVEGDRQVHSMHGYFLLAGDSTLPMTYAVDRIHDGSSFSRRRVQALQAGRLVFSAILSFQVEEEGIDHAVCFATPVPEPESLTEYLAEDPTAARGSPLSRFWAEEKPFELRPVPGELNLTIDGAAATHVATWIRAAAPIADDPQLHRAAIAYASDYGMLGPVLAHHGARITDPGLRIASLDHALWWHQFGRADEWMLYIHSTPGAHGGRGLAFGRLYDRSGALLANSAQEGMIRIAR